MSFGSWTIWIPETRRERARGLLGRSGLEPDEGFLLEHTRSVHTFGMRFPIDAVLLDRDDRVIAVVRLSPNRVLLPRAHVRSVLEVASEVPLAMLRTAAVGREANHQDAVVLHPDGIPDVPGEHVPVDHGLVRLD